MEVLSIHTGAPTVNWDYNTSFIPVVEAKIVTPRVKHIDITVCFLQEQFAMVYLFQHIKILVSCYQICVPNYVRVQLSAVIISG